MAPRPSTFRQSDITRAVKGAMAAGVTVHEIVATSDGIRIISSAGQKSVPIENASDGASPFQKWKEGNAGKT